MVKRSSDSIDAIFHALSDSTRRAILSRLAKSEQTVSELARPFDMSLAAVSKHLKVLEEADFVQKTKDGRTYRCRANLAPLSEVSGLLEELGSFWRGRLDMLDTFLKDEITKKGDQYGRKRSK
ncbi:MAG: metalloregulator ArsR/SmtB family transcription factor [Oligoflexia bacterium]|nr:metalloregulator ArsR/SmtB family transcription factor [Oligoflexia bacterium]